ncbi:serine hydrolase [Dyadobacter sp. CY343]|uniref:serine hydrolase n=1 Tax=Dyadobacter sp. CY343 TaxID=2907299 RepID=UPI001F3488AA|nr:serine hydrolase [Dyadobacter sp. CY343]MCE7060283.1 serine hydrolase [Dyadobacter sp. CY343]
MKIQFLKSAGACLIFCTVLFATSCKEDQILQESIGEQNVGDDSNAKLVIPTKLDVDIFAERIEDYLGNVGFGYSIFVNGEESFMSNGGDGFARKHSEGTGFAKHSAVRLQETNATTQYVTALAVLRVIKKYNLSLKTKVSLYLPKGWVPSKQFKELNFERLLAHRTGLINYGNVRKTVEGQLTESVFISGDRRNNDINYILLGVIAPYVEAVELKKQGDASKFNNLSQHNSDVAILSACGIHFRNLVRNNVFLPAGLANSDVIDWQAWDKNGPIAASLSTQGYPEKLGDAPGIDKAIVTTSCGATGLYLSASDFAKIQSAVNQNKIINATDFLAMKSKLLGFDGVLKGTKGLYYYKTGLGYNCENIIMDFGNVQVAVFANSPQSDFAEKPTVIAQLFEDSLK